MSRDLAILAAADRFEFHPTPKSRLSGFGCRFDAQTGSLDPLHVRLLLVQQGLDRVLWVSCDLLGFSTKQDRTFREQLATALGVGVQQIMISCTHTHSAPVAAPLRGPSGVSDAAWIQSEIFDRTVRAALALNEKLKPVRGFRYGEALVPGLGYNRQDSRWPIDEKVYCVSLVGENERAIGTVVNYALHPVVIGEFNLKCSADFPGYVCSNVEAALGGTALFVNGASGDVDPVIYRDVGRHAGTVETIKQIGSMIARAAVGSLEPVYVTGQAVQIKAGKAALPLDPPPPADAVRVLHDQFEMDQGRLAQDPKDPVGRGAAFQYVWARDLLKAIENNKVPSEMSVNVSALKLGPVWVLGFPAEIYSHIGLELKKRLAPRHVWIAAYTHGIIGYVVSAAAKEQGGYGAGYSHRYFPELLTAIGVGADERLIEQGIALVQSLEQSAGGKP